VVRVALDYAAENPDEIRSRIDRNRTAAEASRRATEERAALIT
jgi:hypothetical protein